MLNIKLNNKTVGLKKACEELGVKYSTIYQRIKMKGLTFEEALAIDGLEINKEVKKEEKEMKQLNKKKVMILNDIHIPYQLDELVQKIRSVYTGEVDEIIFGGDIIDCESLSRFGKKRRVSLSYEIDKTIELLNEIKQEFKPNVMHYVGGNHDKDRYERVVENLKEKDLYCFLPESLIEEVCSRVDGLQAVDHWFGKFYDNLIVCHPKSFSNIPAKISEQCAEYFTNGGVLNRGDVVVTGHTHKFSRIIATRRNNVTVIENGCLCKPMEYADKGQLSYGNQINCFTVIELVEGQPIDNNDIRTYFI